MLITKHAVFTITRKLTGLLLNFTAVIHIIPVSPAMKKKDAVLRKYGRKVSSTKKPSYAVPADMS